ncbi:efflux RND transporter periplasmic adaptor subunit [Exilibacterium tricleocarpae]|uniref:Efflux RND transporter periplasmic adaptor subunit n=1 Tax=Exilibacterium tricleocarpae TaxID=2591008 RepID=A0A545TSF3_9GAMM|nr:efflux RND transporter periplasmic adaptor subunit [Exilibacterium tricleocarpae]TQV80139.1 efflux RND transporter periplasmic adaptor subunit [Exilibacterium tricleocarpae]
MQLIQNIWAKNNYRIALLIAGAISLWLLSGVFAGEDSTQVVDASKEVVPLTKVKARYVSAQTYPVTVAIRARTEANRDVDVRAEVSGRIIGLPVAKGGQVEAGDIICELAAEDRALRLAEAESLVAKTQLDYDGALRLKSGGYQSRTAIAGAKAELETAKAELKRRQLDLNNVKIRAPFAGVVDKRPVEIGDFMERGDVCATVLDLDPLVITGRVSETEVGLLPEGGQASASLLTGEQVEGTIRFVEHSSDPVTRTFRVEVAVPNPGQQLRSGITAQLGVKAGEIAAHRVPSALLSLDDEGKVGLRILDGEHRVQFVTVDIVGDHPQGVWVAGLPDNALLITVGQEYVSSGEEVVVSFENQPGVAATQLTGAPN